MISHNYDPCNNCTIKYQCKPSSSMQEKLRTGWLYCNAKITSQDDPIKQDWDGACAVCRWGNVRCTNPDSPMYKKKINCSDTCNEYRHHGKRGK